ncbi:MULTISPECIES: MFS transporter [Streptomyces]|uniref:MFS family permease n=1 Tax=Streptomyces clavifer TaxID=68188 RepID=A0ABS4VJR2_9ACTN|nr:MULTISPECIES: MFS transporter [Streptomyces]MBP2363983.1 MFS family permease [Streptomyces clavifer]MDX2744582.1 MFS transporter [Streptomyces sp. NRRL_B-2557]MDX3063301.1 MFS transporter [Streptomyces sp. ND04-05B]RPK85462.1 putative multidrug-efflux transporter [Streptomyces sp. ADI97-07]WRY85866.1 MFS transporter [Streptomyces clavifer]
MADRIPAVLRQKNFRNFWTAQTVSYMGDQVTSIVLPLIAVMALDASAADMGMLVTLQQLPLLLFSLHAGAWVDRRGRRRATMIAANLASAAAVATVPLAYFTDALTLLHLYVVSFVIGTLAVVFSVAVPGLFASLVPREQYLSATSLSRASYSFSFVAGPSVGGVIVQILSAPFALLLDVFSFLVAAVMLRTVSVEETKKEETESQRGIREALRFLGRSAVLRAKILSGTALNFFYTVYSTLLILFAARDLGLSAGLVGAVISVGAVGALIGSAITGKVSARLGLGPTYLIGCLIFPAALVLTPLAHGPQWIVVTMLVIGEFASALGLMLFDISGATLQQAITPDRLRSRMQGAQMAISYGVRPVGALVAGGMGTLIGVRPTLWFAVVGGLLSVLFLFWSPLRRVHDLPDEAE